MLRTSGPKAGEVLQVLLRTIRGKLLQNGLNQAGSVGFVVRSYSPSVLRGVRILIGAHTLRKGPQVGRRT